jgi:hypothetical protein
MKTAVGWSRCNGRDFEKWQKYYGAHNDDFPFPFPFVENRDPWQLVTSETHFFRGEHFKCQKENFCHLCGYTGLHDHNWIHPLPACPEWLERTLFVGNCCIHWLDPKEIRAEQKEWDEEQAALRRKQALEKLGSKARYNHETGIQPNHMLRLFASFERQGIDYRPADYKLTLSCKEAKLELVELSDSDAMRLPLTAEQLKRWANPDYILDQLAAAYVPYAATIEEV